MSTANEATRNYLRYAELKNYKSISDLSIDFKPGLNIIIGKNGSGKTNFLGAVNNILNFHYDKQPDTESKVEINFGPTVINVDAHVSGEDLNINSGTSFMPLPYHYHDITTVVNGKSIGLDGDDHAFDFKTKLFNRGFYFSNKIIRHGSPYANSELIDSPSSFTLINNGIASRERISKYSEGLPFIENFFWGLYLYFIKDNKLNKNVLIDGFQGALFQFNTLAFDYLNYYLNNFSPIERVRLNPDFKIVDEDSGKKISLINLFLEFKVNEKWLPYQFLSDGSKRLFYIISEIISIGTKDILGDYSLQTILLEEPELGIHPHQLHQLMLFLKEQAHDKQIILTTHSPQVLDVLNPDELDRIIICEYDQQKGTQLRHLNENQIKKASRYMQEEAFLSDYWRFSDLEPA